MGSQSDKRSEGFQNHHPQGDRLTVSYWHSHRRGDRSPSSHKNLLP